MVAAAAVAAVPGNRRGATSTGTSTGNATGSTANHPPPLQHAVSSLSIMNPAAAHTTHLHTHDGFEPHLHRVPEAPQLHRRNSDSNIGVGVGAGVPAAAAESRTPELRPKETDRLLSPLRMPLAAVYNLNAGLRPGVRFVRECVCE